MSTRLTRRFEKLHTEGRAALVTFTMAFDPDLATSLAIMKELPKAGADVIELGVPFSDPMADGKIIQAAAIRARAQGATLAKILGMVGEFRKTDAETPVILMGYYNPIYHYGVQKFADDAARAGVDGVIIVDLPPEEEAECVDDLTRKTITNVRLIAPTSVPERLPLLLKKTDGFVYYISVLGVTGTKSADLSRMEKDVAHIRAHSKLPVCVGFGIKTPEQAMQVAQCADGVVVGSALVEKITQHAGNAAQAKDSLLALVKDIAQAVRSVKKSGSISNSA